YFFVPVSGHPPHLHSFPTRRSSDLPGPISIRVSPRSSSRVGIGRVGAGGVGGSTIVFSLELLCIVAAPFCTSLATLVSIADCVRSEEHTSELQSRSDLVCRLLLEKK